MWSTGMMSPDWWKEAAISRKWYRDENAFAVRRFLVVVLLGSRIHQFEMDHISFCDKSVILEILAGLDVILILICPVKLDLFALIWDGVDTLFISAFGDKIPFFIIAVEETVKMGIDIRFQP